MNRDDIETDVSGSESVTLVPLGERLRVLIEHTYLFCELLPHKNFAVMKKHYKAYVSGFPGAVDLRIKLMEQDSPAAVEAVVHAFMRESLRTL